MKSAIPWILIVVLLAGGFFLFSANKDKESQLAKLMQDNAEVEKLRAENEDLKKQSVSPEELARLRKDNEEVLRLRNEVQRLRDQASQLNKQLAAAQAQGSQAHQAQEQLSKLATENEALRSQTEKAAQAQAQAQLEARNHDTCVNFLRIIDGAKQQWALENKKTETDTPAAADLAPYLPKDATLTCPSGGTYSINAINQPPTCSIPGHVLK